MTEDIELCLDCGWNEHMHNMDYIYACSIFRPPYKEKKTTLDTK